MTARRPLLQLPAASYLYVLHLDRLGLAWEYLRRHPDYRQDWLRRNQSDRSLRRWGLRSLEDPRLDARDAHPNWFPDHDCVLHLYPDMDPEPDAPVFDFWRLPGEKRLAHDGRRLMLQVRSPSRHVRLMLAQGVKDGMAYALAAKCRYVLRAGPTMLEQGGRDLLAAARRRPNRDMLIHMQMLQALDVAQTGASCREIAEVMVGTGAIARDWYADGGLRSRVRRLVRRGERLMERGYRQLAQLDVTQEAVAAARLRRASEYRIDQVDRVAKGSRT